MTMLAAEVLSTLAGLLHLAIFVAETLLWRRRSIWRLFGVRDQAAADAAAFYTYNQGFYNLFLAVGALAGPACLLAGASDTGWTLLVYACGSMLAAAIVLRWYGGRFFTKAAAVQATLPFAALLASLAVAA